MMRRIHRHIVSPVSIAPLVTFRILFGFIMLVSLLRFAARGWIYDLYVAPAYFFTYYGFDWVKPLGAWGMYALFGMMGLSALAIMLGYRYRIATAFFFVMFTYVELIDKTNYLNHYYFVSIIAFLLMLTPAHRSFSLDALRKPAIRCESVPAWTINLFKVQLGLVYFFAGLAKLNPDWLVDAMPLKLWLPAYAHLPLIGPFLELPETAYLFSWAGALYDLTIVFFLLAARTRPFAYAAVVGFHLMTALLFQIGMFPYIMMLATLIYFSPRWHETILDRLSRGLRAIRISGSDVQRRGAVYTPGPLAAKAFGVVLTLHLVLQVFLPFRYALYPGNLFWSEEGYRFSWRVMLMEKAGHTVFRVKDNTTSRWWEVANWEYLTPNQEKMMATQPDMILQFAHFLKDQYTSQGLDDIVISVDSRVTLNGRRSRPFINPETDLSKVSRGWKHKDWIVPFEE